MRKCTMILVLLVDTILETICLILDFENYSIPTICHRWRIKYIMNTENNFFLDARNHSNVAKVNQPPVVKIAIPLVLCIRNVCSCVLPLQVYINRNVSRMQTK